MSVAQVLIFAAIAAQSLGKVLYGTFLSGISTPLFVLVGVGLTAAVSVCCGIRLCLQCGL